MIIREAQPSDIPDILGLWNDAIRSSEATFESVEKTAEQVAALINERASAGHATLVASDGGFLGFGTYAQFRGGTGYARTMEHTIYVDPAARGRGAARALMAALEDHAARAGAHSMIAGVSSANADGVTFHAHRGYVEVARVPEVGHKWGRTYDLILLQKILSPRKPSD